MRAFQMWKFETPESLNSDLCESFLDFEGPALPEEGKNKTEVLADEPSFAAALKDPESEFADAAAPSVRVYLCSNSKLERISF